MILYVLYDIQLTILTAKLYIGITEKKKKVTVIVFWKILELQVKRGWTESGVWNVSGMYNITVRQSVIKKCANQVQMLKE